MTDSVQFAVPAGTKESALDAGSRTPPPQELSRDTEKFEHAQTFQSVANTTDEEVGPLEPSPERRVEVKQKWNEPRVNTCRFLTTIYSFIVMGMNDGAVGVSRTSRL